MSEILSRYLGSSNSRCVPQRCALRPKVTRTAVATLRALPLRTERSPPVHKAVSVDRSRRLGRSPACGPQAPRTRAEGSSRTCAAPRTAPRQAASRRHMQRTQAIAAACATQRLHATLHAPSLYAALTAYEPLRTFSEGTGRAVRSALLSAPCFRSPARRTAQSHDDASRSGTEVRRGRTSDARWLAAAVTVTTWRFSATAERASLFMRLARSSHT